MNHKAAGLVRSENRTFIDTDDYEDSKINVLGVFGVQNTVERSVRNQGDQHD